RSFQLVENLLGILVVRDLRQQPLDAFLLFILEQLLHQTGDGRLTEAKAGNADQHAKQMLRQRRAVFGVPAQRVGKIERMLLRTVAAREAGPKQPDRAVVTRQFFALQTIREPERRRDVTQTDNLGMAD